MREVGDLVSIVGKNEPGIVAKVLSNNKILLWLCYSTLVELFDSSDERLISFDKTWLEKEALKSFLRGCSYDMLDLLEIENLELIANIYTEAK